MLHGRRITPSLNKTLFRLLHIQSKTTITQPHTPPTKLGTFLLIASIVKSLSEPGGTRNLNHEETSRIQLSDSLVCEILTRTSLDVYQKIDFFKWCSLQRDYKPSAIAYSQMLKTLSINPVVYKDLIFDFLSSMNLEGVALDSSTFKSLLDSFIKSGNFDSALEILDHVENILDKLNPDVYNSILIALVRSNHLNMAVFTFFKLFDSVNDHDVSFIDISACNELLVALRKSGMKSEFVNVFNKCREKVKNFPSDARGYNVCIHAFGNWGEFETSLNLFNELKETSGSGPDLCSYNSLIQSLCFNGRPNDALIIFEELKSSGHEPDEFTYRLIIQGLCKCYKINDAARIFGEMQHNGFKPGMIVFNALLDGFLKSGKVTEACQLFEKMVDDGMRASCWTYNILIDGLFKNRKGQAAYALFSELKKKGRFVDGITYSIVVFRLCKDGLIDEALELVEEMESRGFDVDLVTITHLLKAVNTESRADLTERILKRVKNRSLVSSVREWKANTEMLMNDSKNRKKDFTPMFKTGEFSEIMSLITSRESGRLLISSRGKRVNEKSVDSFDVNMMNTYLSIYLTKGKLSLACKLFDLFTDLGVDPVNYTYNSLMSALVKRGYLNEACGVFTEMGEKSADVATYDVIFQALGQLGRTDLVGVVLRKLTEVGFLDVVMYNTLISVLGKGGRFDEANRVFEEMKKSGINPDVVTYNTLLEVYSKAGRLKDARRVLKMMVDAGCAPNHVTDTILEFLEKEIKKEKLKQN